MVNSGVAIWNLELNKLLPGPNIDTLIDEIEESKKITGGFHPHVARRIFSTIMADWKYAHCWKIPESRENNVWKVRVSITKFVGGRWRKLIIFKLQQIFHIKKYLFSGTFSAEHAAINKEPAITECALSMLQQFYIARIIPSDLYYRRQPTPVGPTAVEDTTDSIIVDVPVAEKAATLQNLIDQGRSHEAASSYCCTDKCVCETDCIELCIAGIYHSVGGVASSGQH
jgi:hypothetical protein